MSRFEIAQLRALPQDPAAVWQGGWLPIPLRIEGEGPDHPGQVSAFWGVTGGGPQGPELDPRVVGTTSHAELLSALVRFAVSKRTAGYRPGRVEVCEAAEAEFLRGPLGEAGIAVALVAGPPSRLPALADFAEFMRTAVPGLEDLALFSVPGMTLARVWSFADAACEFYLAAPWERLDGDEDPLRVVQPSPAPELQFVSVLGSSGESFGLGFHDTWNDFLTLVRGDERRPASELVGDLRSCRRIPRRPTSRPGRPTACRSPTKTRTRWPCASTPATAARGPRRRRNSPILEGLLQSDRARGRRRPRRRPLEPHGPHPRRPGHLRARMPALLDPPSRRGSARARLAARSAGLRAPATRPPASLRGRTAGRCRRDEPHPRRAITPAARSTTFPSRPATTGTAPRSCATPPSPRTAGAASRWRGKLCAWILVAPMPG